MNDKNKKNKINEYKNTNYESTGKIKKYISINIFFKIYRLLRI